MMFQITQMRLKILLFVALIVPKLGIAGGTLGTNELSSLMAQMPEVRDFLRSSLRLSDSAYAEIRLGSDFIHLSGARMGPYSIDAKSQKSGKSLVVVLCTKARFLDSNGRELPETRMNQAVSIDEKLTGVMLRQEGDTEVWPPC
ncbi:MAG: hypothetical protein ACXWC4_05295 [Telluria sp.]